MNITRELLRLLMEIAILNYDKGFSKEAEIIIEGISYCIPESAYPSIGMACVQMHNGNFENAINILRNAPCQDYMQRELCNSYLGKALKLDGYNEEAEKILNYVVQNGSYDIAVNYAKELLAME